MDGRRNRTEGKPPPPPRPPPLSFPRDLRDHISALPDDVIHRIFSFLPFKDVVKTSALSKRWQHAWATATPHLEFDGLWHRNHEASSSGFQSLVDSVLRQCTSPSVKKFHITHFRYSEADGPKLEHWLCAAEERHVEDLRVSLLTNFWSPYVLPQFLFCSNWLVRLEVGSCCFSLGTTIMWPCLKVLSMVKVKLSDDILGRIFRGSPVLESLKLRGCWGMKNIVIDSTSVKHLLLIGGSFSNLEKIRAPHLLSLHVSGTWHPPKGQGDISLDDVSSLVEAKLDFVIITGRPGERTMCHNLLKELLEKLCGVPTITIGGWCLKLELELGEESEDPVNFDEEELLCLRKGNLECLAKHLKRVEIIGIGADRFGSNHLLALIKFLLGDALVLEKLVIKVKLPTTFVPWKLLGASKIVRSFRKASENAQVIFDWCLCRSI